MNIRNSVTDHRSLDLTQVADDLVNLRGSTNAPLVVVDRELRIRRVAAAAAGVLKLTSSDVGRLLSDVHLGIKVANLEQLVARVIESHTPAELEVVDTLAHRHWLQIRPSRVSREADGAAMELADIYTGKHFHTRFKKSSRFYAAIMNTMDQPFLILDSDWRVMYASPSFLRTFQVRWDETEGELLYRIGHGRWDIPRLKVFLEEAARRGIPSRNFEVEVEKNFFKPRKRVVFHALPLKNVPHDVNWVLLMIEDITARKQAEEILTSARDELETKVQMRTAELERLSGQILRVQDQERRRLARELHDSSGQLLVALSMNLTPLQSKANKLNRESVNRVRESLTLVDQLSSELRTVSHLLHPPLLDEVGLSSGLHSYLKKFTERSKIKVDLELPDGFGRIPQSLEITIFRVVQECLTNIVRHSESRVARVRLTRSDTEVRLEVLDRGKGISPEKQQLIKSGAGIGIGIGGMRERVRHLGGSLEIHSARNGEGTRILARLPLASGSFTAAA